MEGWIIKTPYLPQKTTAKLSSLPGGCNLNRLIFGFLRRASAEGIHNDNKFIRSEDYWSDFQMLREQIENSRLAKL